MNKMRLFIPLLILMMAMVIAFGMSVSVTQAQSFGSGWTGSYFDNGDLTGSAVIGRLDSQINFNFGTSSPNPPWIPEDNFSIRWNSLESFAAGVYRFTVGADDGARAYLDGQLILDMWGNTGAFNFATADITVTEGSHDITVEYRELSGNAAVQFFWEPISTVATGTAGPTPTPTATGLPPIPAGALTATVIRAGVLNVRDAPSLGGNVIGRILRGQTYQIVGRDPDARWFLVQLSGYQGWIYGYYVFTNRNEFTAPIRSATTLYGIPSGFVDTGVIAQPLAGMRLRAEPNILSEQTGRIIWGSFLPVVARTAGGDWYQVLWKGSIGWVFTGFARIVQGDLANVPVV